ncbi:hypothetical protein Ctob_013157 [Chrysochromulina tobinii]|uniref:Uncharacterized protein n=1 Tax=Chrysochromulina tobinii TaxID=1460289 RepID=A0A0M0K4P0_9EUKA|nr:hypothetical protein Ctob_013157 [Chrysochromulina tobinii]|eukprot:KOO33774.1 hypothetical protein Ctob_013157 [Chrysochromulina sp. CCMP291]
MLARVLCIVAFFAFSAEAFVAPASPALSVSVAARGQTSIDMMAAPKKPVKKAAPKVVAKKPVKKVVKKAAPKPVAKKAAPKPVAKKVAPKKVAPKKVAPKKVAPKKSAVKSGFRPGKQMPASQAVNELLGGIFNAFNLLRSLPK